MTIKAILDLTYDSAIHIQDTTHTYAMDANVVEDYDNKRFTVTITFKNDINREFAEDITEALRERGEAYITTPYTTEYDLPQDPKTRERFDFS